ncbi:alpha/beta hydrolase [Bradyrhizobium tropiciagri]|uniref:alpha/beta hydrolase n=1 Tax=Bradyrhizobium tropiciagri TaxID=312253 RepID=UPI000AA7F403|nr:alpha/beta fold hydrolase [Bradyrhizobium tropiciagri]
MMHSDHSRRTIIKGIGVATAGVLGAAPAQAAMAVPTEGEIWSNEYWAKKGDVPLWMFRKRIGAPKPGEPARPVVFFVHGSSVTSRVFDLTVPGKGEYSLLNVFARYGFDCWTMDHENYGKSGRTSDNADIASGVEDLKAAVEVIARETGERRYHFIGESSGALRAGAFAMAAPERIGGWCSPPSHIKARVRRHWQSAPSSSPITAATTCASATAT